MIRMFATFPTSEFAGIPRICASPAHEPGASLIDPELHQFVLREEDTFGQCRYLAGTAGIIASFDYNIQEPEIRCFIHYAPHPVYRKQ